MMTQVPNFPSTTSEPQLYEIFYTFSKIVNCIHLLTVFYLYVAKSYILNSCLENTQEGS